MIQVNELRARMVAKGYTQEQVAEKMNITPKTLSLKLSRGVFNSDEMQKLIEILDIKNPSFIFFGIE